MTLLEILILGSFMAMAILSLAKLPRYQRRNLLLFLLVALAMAGIGGTLYFLFLALASL